MANTQPNVHHSPIALTYAQAMLDLANAQGQAEAIGQELHDIRQIIQADPAFALFLADPAISAAEREGIVLRTFGDGKVSPLVMNLLRVMSDKGRLGLLEEMADAYHDLLQTQQGKVQVDVTVAQRLTDDQLEQVRQRISAALKKDAIVRQLIDDSIIGGLVIRVEDKLIDASARHQLQAMREQLLAAGPK